MKNIFFLLLFPLITFAQEMEFKNGDLIFQNLKCGPMCEAINAVTEGFEGNNFNHIGLIVVKQDKFYVIESLGEGVRSISLHHFLNYTDKPVFVGRLKPEHQHLIPDAIVFAQRQIGIPYDNEFLYNNGKYYCSELIYDAFLFANDNQPFFQLFPMTYKEPDSENFFPVWTTHFAKHNISIPEGKLGCNPGSMSLDDKIDIFKLH